MLAEGTGEYKWKTDHLPKVHDRMQGTTGERVCIAFTGARTGFWMISVDFSDGGGGSHGSC